ncbi:MAG: hypothetical protein EXQ88_07030 [Alphaproteobacteria bacterium]|nr:hypothetical protein [Alphaproteobacteria bacterium]
MHTNFFLKRLARLATALFPSRKAKAKGLAPHGTDLFLKDVSGIIHVGGHLGQERETYRALGHKVIWVEAIPAIHERLEKAISRLPEQRALCLLLTDTDGTVFNFNVSSNNGASSSIFDLGEHTKIWPKVSMVRMIRLEG